MEQLNTGSSSQEPTSIARSDPCDNLKNTMKQKTLPRTHDPFGDEAISPGSDGEYNQDDEGDGSIKNLRPIPPHQRLTGVWGLLKKLFPPRRFK